MSVSSPLCDVYVCMRVFVHASLTLVVNEQLPSCSWNGHWDVRLGRCVCSRGYGGADCGSCAVASAGNAQVCVPTRSPLYQGYMLMTLPAAYAAGIVDGSRKPDSTCNYNGIYPNSQGKDGKHYGCDCFPSDGNKRRSAAPVSVRGIPQASLSLYTQVVVQCVDQSTLTSQQMAELDNMWYTAVQLEQQNRLNDTWYIVGIIFIILFFLLLTGIIVYCFVKNYTQTTGGGGDKSEDNVPIQGRIRRAPPTRSGEYRVQVK